MGRGTRYRIKAIWHEMLLVSLGVTMSCGQPAPPAPPAQNDASTPSHHSANATPSQDHPHTEQAPTPPNLSLEVGTYRQLTWRWGAPKGAYRLPSTKHPETPLVSSNDAGEVTVLGVDGRVTTRYRIDTRSDALVVTVTDGTGRLLERRTVRDDGRRLERHDASGQPYDPACAYWSRTLDSKGFVQVSRCMGPDNSPQLDREGAHLRRYVRTTSGLVSEEHWEHVSGVAVPIQAPFGQRGPARAIFSRHWEYDAQGRMAQSLVRDASGKPTRDAHGVYSRHQSYDGRGRLSVERLVDESGQACQPVAARRWTYSEQGALISESLENANGESTVGTHGYAIIDYRVDNQNRPIRIQWKNAKGLPVDHRQRFWAEERRRYDLASRLIQQRWFDARGQPWLNPRTGCAGQRFAYDDQGRMTEQHCLSTTGKVWAPPTQGYATTKRRYDSQSRIIEESFHNPDGSPAMNRDGVSRLISQFDTGEQDGVIRTNRHAENIDGNASRLAGDWYMRVEEQRNPQGQLLSRRVFDGDAKPHITQRGRIHAEFRRYNAQGHLVETHWEDTSGALTPHAVTRAARVRITRDSAGGELGREYFDAKGTPTLGREGWAKRTQDLDSRGEVITQRHFDIAGRPVHDLTHGAAHIRYERDGFGALLRKIHYGVGDKPNTSRDGGYAGQRWTYDTQGRIATISYEDSLGQLIVNRTLGYARTAYTYDAMDRVIRQSFGTPHYESATVPEQGYAAVILDYDQWGRPTQKRFLNAQDDLTVTPLGYAQIQWNYPAVDVTVESYLDTEGQNTFARAGYAIKSTRRDAMGRALEERYLNTQAHGMRDLSGAVTRAWHYTGPAITWERSYDSDEHLVAARDGYAGVDRDIDAWGRITRKSQRGIAHEEVADFITGCVAIHRQYQATGELERESCHGHDGPTLTHDGWHARIYQHDAQGRVTRVRYEDTSSQPVNGPEAWAERADTFDARGYLSRRRYLNAKGNETPGPEGQATIAYTRDLLGQVTRLDYASPQEQESRDQLCRVTRRYDRIGHLTEQAHYDCQERPITVDGCAIIKYRTRPDGRRLSQECLDAKWEHTIGQAGYARMDIAYTNQGQIRQRDYFGTGGQPGHARLKIASERWTYDAYGRVLKAEHLGSSGEHVVPAGPAETQWAVQTRHYDALGELIGQTFRGLKGRPVPSPRGVFRHSAWLYDNSGLLKRTQRVDGYHRAAPRGWASQRYDYDGVGRLTRIRYENAAGQPAAIWNGVGQTKFSYDELGRLASQSYYSPAGKPINAQPCYPTLWCGKTRFHQAVYVYRGLQATELEFYDLRGSHKGGMNCSKRGCF